MGWAELPNKLLAESCLASRPTPHPFKHKMTAFLASGAPSQPFLPSPTGFATTRNSNELKKDFTCKSKVLAVFPVKPVKR